jgi:hypothetical protein
MGKEAWPVGGKLCVTEEDVAKALAWAAVAFAAAEYFTDPSEVLERYANHLHEVVHRVADEPACRILRRTSEILMATEHERH